MEKSATEGDSPVGANLGMASSRVRLEKPGLNMGGPPSKPEYSSMTDSEPVRRLNGEKHPDKGREIAPEIMCLHSGHGPQGLWRAFCIMIWRVTLYGKAKPNPGAVEGKPSLKRACSRRG